MIGVLGDHSLALLSHSFLLWALRTALQMVTMSTPLPALPCTPLPDFLTTTLHNLA